MDMDMEGELILITKGAADCEFYDKDDILTNSPPARRVPVSVYSPGGTIQMSAGNNSPSLKVQMHHSTSSPQRN
eukprot:00538_5